MPALETIKELYRSYLSETERLQRERRPGDGLLGFGSGPKDDKCHGIFIDAVMTALDDAASFTTGPANAREILDYIFSAPLLNSGNSLAYWMLLAVHGQALGLVELLSPPDAAELLAWYKNAYPRRDRLPAQKKVILALKKRAEPGGNSSGGSIKKPFPRRR